MRSHATKVFCASLFIAVLAGCSSTTETNSATETAKAATESSPVTTVNNCGTEVQFDDVPEAVVTIKSTSTEMLLSLGLEDHIIGTAFEDSPLPEHLSQQATDIPVLSDNVPGQEALLELEPDLVYAGWESNFSSDSAGEREQLQQLGINTYVSPAACRSEEYQLDELTFDTIFSHIQEIGDIFDVPEAADALIAEQQAILDSVEPLGEGQTALWYSSGSTTPYVGAGIGAPAMIMKQLGFENIAGDVSDTWTELSWEVIAERDPDMLILVDSQWNTAENKMEILESGPVTSQLTAVKEKNYLVLPFAASEAGVRNAEAVKDLAEQMRAQ